MSKVTTGVTLNGHRTRWTIWTRGDHNAERPDFAIFARLELAGGIASYEFTQAFLKCVDHRYADGEALKGFWRMFRALEAKSETVLKPTRREDENLLDPLWALYRSVWHHQNGSTYPGQQTPPEGEPEP